MRKTISAAILAGSAILGTIPVTASASARPATIAQQTCIAFTAWQQHKTTARLDRLVTVSLGLPHGYLAGDVAQLYADSVTAKPKAKYIRSDARYVSEDCAKV